VVFTGGALTLYAARAGQMTAKGVFAPVSREGALVLNNVLLAVSAFVVFIGTMWPLIAEMLWDRKLSVGPPFFNQAFTPFMIVLAIVLPLGSIMPWKRATLSRIMRPLWGAFVLAGAVMALVFAVSTGRSAVAVIGAGLGAWIIFGALAELVHRTGGSGLSRLLRLPRADWGKATAHAGMGVTFIGVALLTAWQVEDIRVAQVGQPFTVGGYDITLASVDEVEGPNFISTTATMQVARDGRPVAVLHPEKRVYPVQAMPTTEAAIDNGIFRDIYLVIGDAQADGGWAVRTYIKPFANWIWAGSLLMALGGIISLSDRRYRVAAGARRAPAKTVAAE
jgi:cytochrome c-type biogenesis protein CcmF